MNRSIQFPTIFSLFVLTLFVVGCGCGDDDDDNDGVPADDDDTGDDDDDNDGTPADDDDTGDDDSSTTCAAWFDGVGSYGQTSGDLTPNLTDGYTAEAWFNLDTLADNVDLLTANKEDSSEFYHGFELYVLAEGNIRFCIGNGDSSGSSHCVQGTTSLVTGTWYHGAGTIDGGTMCVYLNGIQEDCETPGITLIPDASAPLYVGQDGYSGAYFDGGIDEARISSVVRYMGDFTPEATFVPDGDTVALYHFDECDGTTASDATTNGNDLTLYQGVVWTEH